MKRLIVVVLCLMLSACGTPSKEPVKEETKKEEVSIRIDDKKKEYAYSKESYEQKPNEEFKKNIKDIKLENIVINIKSEDSKKIQDILDKEYKRMKDESNSDTVYNLNIKSINENDKYISIVINYNTIKYQSELNSNSYIILNFNKKDGSLIDDDTILKDMGLDSNKVKEIVNKDYSSKNISICKDSPNKCYIDAFDIIYKNRLPKVFSDVLSNTSSLYINDNKELAINILVMESMNYYTNNEVIIKK
ncbi:MAG: hypothetical protein RR546_07475 [Erysipelotrichaceae bacterium]